MRHRLKGRYVRVRSTKLGSHQITAPVSKDKMLGFGGYNDTVLNAQFNRMI